MTDPAAARTDVAAINKIKRLSSQALLAGMIGNILEWYDFGLYGFLAPIIGALIGGVIGWTQRRT